MIAVFRKELKSYFTGFIGYAFMTILLLILGFYSVVYNLSYGYAQFELVYAASTFVFFIIIPILTMRIYPEERKQKTDQLLYSLPLRMSDIVLGKYFAALFVFAVPCAISAVYPLILSAFGTVNFKVIYATLLYFFLLGAALIAICTFISSLTENQIIAAIISFVVLFINYMASNFISSIPDTLFFSVLVLVITIILISVLTSVITKNKPLAEMVSIVLLLAVIVIFFVKSELLTGLAPKVFEKILLFDGIFELIDGAFNLESVILLVSFAVLFNFFTVQVLEKRRWA